LAQGLYSDRPGGSSSIVPFRPGAELPQSGSAMAVLARVFVVMAACCVVALGNNATNATTSTATSTTTLSTTYTTSATATATATATVTITTGDITSNDVNSTTTGASTTATTTTGAPFQHQISGTITMQITGDCAAFVSDDKVIAAFMGSIASIANVSSSWVTVTLSHTCSSRRMSELHGGKSALRRRLGGAVIATYTITFPVGSSVTSATASVSLIEGTSTASWSSTLATELVDQGVSSSAYTVTITEVATPSVGTVTVTTVTTTSTLTLTTILNLESGVDSSAFSHKAFSTAHLVGLLLVFVSSKLFA